jgi:hypothetical protein
MVLAGASCAAQVSGVSELRPAPRDVQLFVQQALADRIAAGDLPDFTMLQGVRRIAVRQEMPQSGLTLGADALPRIAGREFHLLSTRAASDEAERTKQNVTFITVDSATIAGDDATIALGVDFAAPKDPTLLKMCCCEGVAQYRREHDRWRFVEWKMTRCS